MKRDVITRISELNPAIRGRGYASQFDAMYGALWEAFAVDEEVEDEIVRAESLRMSSSGELAFAPIGSAYELVRRYSALSFSLAAARATTGKGSKLAEMLLVVFRSLLDGGFLSKEERSHLMRDISETELDLMYASGSSDNTSLRMMPLLKSMQEGSR